MSVRTMKDKIGLRAVLDRLEPKSPYGRKRLLQTEFYSDRSELAAELDRIRVLRNNPDRLSCGHEAERLLASMKDLGQSALKLKGRSRLTLEELFDIKCLLILLEDLKKLYDEALKLEGLDFLPLDGALSVLDPEGERRYEFALKDDLSAELSRIRAEKRSLEKELYGGKDGGTVRSRFDAVCQEEDREEKRLLGELCQALAPWADALLADMESAGRLDLLLRKAAMPGTVIPELTQESRLVFTEMSEPTFKERFAAKGHGFKMVSLELLPGAAVLTGANMGGKSVALKTLALNCALALCGFPVYAAAAKLPDISDICLISGENEDETEGLSSFGGEMAAIRNALKALDGRTLLLLDEPMRGTNPTEGAALVKALTALLNEKSDYCLLTTHFDGVSELGKRHYTVRDYRPQEMPPDAPIPREALKVCRELGLPEKMLELAEHYLKI